MGAVLSVVVPFLIAVVIMFVLRSVWATRDQVSDTIEVIGAELETRKRDEAENAHVLALFEKMADETTRQGLFQATQQAGQAGQPGQPGQPLAPQPVPHGATGVNYAPGMQQPVPGVYGFQPAAPGMPPRPGVHMQPGVPPQGMAQNPAMPQGMPQGGAQVPYGVPQPGGGQQMPQGAYPPGQSMGQPMGQPGVPPQGFTAPQQPGAAQAQPGNNTYYPPNWPGKPDN